MTIEMYTKPNNKESMEAKKLLKRYNISFNETYLNDISPMVLDVFKRKRRDPPYIFIEQKFLSNGLKDLKRWLKGQYATSSYTMQNLLLIAVHELKNNDNFIVPLQFFLRDVLEDPRYKKSKKYQTIKL